MFLILYWCAFNLCKYKDMQQQQQRQYLQQPRRRLFCLIYACKHARTRLYSVQAGARNVTYNSIAAQKNWTPRWRFCKPIKSQDFCPQFWDFFCEKKSHGIKIKITISFLEIGGGIKKEQVFQLALFGIMLGGMPLDCLYYTPICTFHKGKNL